LADASRFALCFGEAKATDEETRKRKREREPEKTVRCTIVGRRADQVDVDLENSRTREMNRRNVGRKGLRGWLGVSRSEPSASAVQITSTEKCA
jgi:hypothetical protein